MDGSRHGDVCVFIRWKREENSTNNEMGRDYATYNISYDNLPVSYGHIMLAYMWVMAGRILRYLALFHEGVRNLISSCTPSAPPK